MRRAMKKIAACRSFTSPFKMACIPLLASSRDILTQLGAGGDPLNDGVHDFLGGLGGVHLLLPLQLKKILAEYKKLTFFVKN